MKQNEPKKRNYVKRKRSLSESTKIILSTLQVINSNSPNPLDNNDLTHIAINHAKAIEATCWSRRAKFSDEIFQTIIRSKTTELCQTLLSSSMSGLLVLSKGDTALPIQNSSSSPSQNINQFLPVNQCNNSQIQQHYLLSSPNDSPSTSPSSNSIECGTTISENKNNSNPIFHYPLIPSYPLPPLEAQVTQSVISSNVRIETNSPQPTNIQQSQPQQPLYNIIQDQQMNNKYILNNIPFSNSALSYQEQSFQNKPTSENFINTKFVKIIKQPNEDEENENNSDCWHKKPPKVKFPSISSLLS